LELKNKYLFVLIARSAFYPARRDLLNAKPFIGGIKHNCLVAVKTFSRDYSGGISHGNVD
jgi:hypothetical protein